MLISRRSRDKARLACISRPRPASSAVSMLLERWHFFQLTNGYLRPSRKKPSNDLITVRARLPPVSDPDPRCLSSFRYPASPPSWKQSLRIVAFLFPAFEVQPCGRDTLFLAPSLHQSPRSRCCLHRSLFSQVSLDPRRTA